MFDDLSDYHSSSTADYEEDSSFIAPRRITRRRQSHQISSSVGGMFGMSNAIKKQRIARLTAHFDEENKRLRKPCPTCGTLVKPALIDQHNDAYHSKLVVSR